MTHESPPVALETDVGEFRIWNYRSAWAESEKTILMKGRFFLSLCALIIYNKIRHNSIHPFPISISLALYNKRR